jgi:DNA (cytosine-5)-methyltransferase 1
VDFGGQSAPEILFEPKSMHGDTQESGAEGQGIADSAETCTRTASECLTPWDVQSRRIHPINAKWPALYGGEGGGHGYAFIPESSGQAVATVDCRNLYENPELSGTLQSKPGGGYSLNYQNPVRIGYAVRRLTPLECERLQGLPDGWTDIPGAKDTPRYKAIGNGLAQPCPDWILARIKERLEGTVG